MTRLTQEELAEIRKRAEAATAGPWRWEDDLHDCEMPDLINDTQSIMDFGDCEMFYPTQGTPPDIFDAEFIAHAREDVPKLLAEIERLQTRLSHAGDLLSEAHDLLDDVHCYDTDVYNAISRYFNGEDDSDD